MMASKRSLNEKVSTAHLEAAADEMRVQKTAHGKAGDAGGRLRGGAVCRIESRVLEGSVCRVTLSTGSQLLVRRFFPAGPGDTVRVNGNSIQVLAKADNAWVEIGDPWRKSVNVRLGPISTRITFKEIETDEELELFESLQKFHYRGRGGAGRTVPLIAVSKLWDLPKILGFIEITSSMIANTARKKFFDFPFSEGDGVSWKVWDRKAAKSYSNTVCRISRFVIHPEIRGLGLAKNFSEAARAYASERWHYGGFRPRFIEITADMLRYYKFIDPEFAYMGDTEGNEHRLVRDMTYLVKRARAEAGPKGMPRGGGGIMVLQRGYASQLLKYLDGKGKSLPDVIGLLRYNAAKLDQDTWEALHRLNRRPKPCYIAGLTERAAKYVALRTHAPLKVGRRTSTTHPAKWAIAGLSIRASAVISQTSEARLLQDAFGFVGSDLSSDLMRDFSFELTPKTVTLICGASGSGKSILVDAIAAVLSHSAGAAIQSRETCSIEVAGDATPRARVVKLQPLDDNVTPLEAKGNGSLEEFLQVSAKCGLAEPQLFVRPIKSLSSGQKYRLQIALCFLRSPEVVVIDNFCEALDTYTAAAVTRGLWQLASERNVAVVAATASYERFQGWLHPHQTILLRRGDRPFVQTL